MFIAFRKILTSWQLTGWILQFLGLARSIHRIEMSSLSHSVTRKGATVEIYIYKWNGEIEWTLEIANSSDDAVVWTEPFQSEELALDVALSAIDQEGIAAFHEASPCTIR